MYIRLLQQLDHIAEALKESCERKKVWLLSAFSIAYLLSTCLLASRKLMWNDELFTLYIARLPRFSDVWSALLTGADQIPPFFHVITRASFSLFGINHLSIRLPEVLGFWLMCLSLFYFVSKRSSALYGFVAMFFPLVTQAYYYAYEARPYGLVLGFSGLSLICWQSAADGHLRKLSLIGLAVSVAAAISNHYYAVLLLFPLALGEMARSVSRHRLDLAVWIAFGAALTPLLLFSPLIERAQTSTGTFWAQPYLKSIPEFYYFLLIPALLPILVIVILSAAYSTSQFSSAGTRTQESRPTPPLHDVVAAFGFITIPVVAVILAVLVTRAFIHRYALPSVMGFSILVAFAASRMLDGRAIIGVALLLSLCGGFMMLEIRNFRNITAASLDLVKTYTFLQSNTDSELPIVASDLHMFMTLAYYAPQNIASRVVYLADPKRSLRHLGHTAVDQGILDLKPWFRLRVEDYGPYIAAQQRFLVYGSVGSLNWLLYELKAADLKIELKGRNGEALLFLVSPKDD